MAVEMVEAAGKWESGAAAVQVGMQATVEMVVISLVFQAQMALLV
jgi:hypothetical protein